MLERAGAVLAMPRELRGLHAKAAVACGLFPRAIEIIGQIAPDLGTEPELVDVEVVARRAVGDHARGNQLADAIALLHPGRPVWIPPLVAEPPVQRKARGPRAPDPLLSLRQAEAYVQAGRPDRAIRVLRRLLVYTPDDLNIRLRLADLQRAPAPERVDDLSDEIPAPGTSAPAPTRGSGAAVPPGLGIPIPSAYTPGPIERRVTDRMYADADADDETPAEGDDEVTDTGLRTDAPRRRRSLISRK